MWRNYLIIALRTLAKSRLFTALNLVGLAVGMAACLLIAMWVRNETTYDQWLPDAERIFVAQAKTQYPGKEMETWGHASAMMLPKLANDFPQIASYTRLLRGERAMRYGARVENQPIVLVDSGFFDVLALPLLEGNTETALKRPDQVAVSDTFAKKWFGSNSAVGQTLTVTVKGEKRPYQVAAVFRDLPSNSMFEFNVLMPFQEADFTTPAQILNWGSFTTLSVVKLKEANTAAAINAGMDGFIEKHAPPFLKVENGFYYRPNLRNITDTHLQELKASANFRPQGDARLVAALAAVGLLILGIATITYINLATARVSLRAREVGLRKTLGAGRGQLMVQFLVESSLIALLAGIFALALVELALPAFNFLLAQKLVLQYLGLHGVLLPLLVMVSFVGVAGGWYPALVLARLRPREAISGQHGAVLKRGRIPLRQLLVIGQFSIAILLMTCMAIIYAQVSYLRNVDMGYQPDGLIVIPGIQRAEVLPNQKALLAALLRVPDVLSATRSMFDPTGSGLARQSAHLPGVPESQAPQISINPVDWGYLKTYGGTIIAGRDLSEKYGNDDWPDLPDEKEAAQRGVNALVNRAALKFFNTTDPNAALGKTFKLGNQAEALRITVTVVGVIEDLRIRSARDEVLPSLYVRGDEGLTAVSVRYKGVPPAEMVSRLEAAWKQMFPETPFTAKLVDEAIVGYYKNETRRGHLFALFAGIAIVLCAVGLYGLAVFTAERRTKEIGIRKVLGAEVSDIVRLLVWQFSKPVMIATLIAWPIAWWLMREWLNGFSVRIPLTPLPFIVAGAYALFIAWITVAWHAMRVARTSPIHALRHE
jgi:putative ABC transport system permease protein